MIAGWYIDILIGYLTRAVIRVVKLRRSDGWPLEDAVIGLLGYRVPSLKFGAPIGTTTREIGLNKNSYRNSPDGELQFFNDGYAHVDVSRRPSLCTETAIQSYIGDKRHTACLEPHDEESLTWSLSDQLDPLLLLDLHGEVWA